MAWQFEAVLLARGPDGREVPIARTRATEAVRGLADALLGEAQAEARALRRLDPLLGRIGRAETRRLAAVLRTVTQGDSDPALRLLK